MNDENCISHWLPPIEAVPTIRTPKTIIVRTDVPLIDLLDGSSPDDLYEFLDELRAACRTIGHPCFLRSGYFSGKHSWLDSCFVRKSSRLLGQVGRIVEDGELASIIGFPWQVWAVREMIRTRPMFHAFDGCMPITREFRFFVEGGAVTHVQPYWPAGAIEDHTNRLTPDNWRELLAEASILSDDLREQLAALSVLAANAVGGDWSVDWLQDADAHWWLIDMARAADSFRYEHGTPLGQLSEGSK